MRALAGLLLAGAAVAACGGREPTYLWRDGAVAMVEVRVREELLPDRVARDVRISARGVVEHGSELALEILSVRHESLLRGATVSAVDTETAGAATSERSSEDAAIARVAEGLIGRKLRLTFDGHDGLRRVAGVDEALASAVTATDAAASEVSHGFAPLLGEIPLLRSLRAAGLAAPPENFRDKSAVVDRRAEVFVPGRGTMTCRLFGDVGFEVDGSPVVRWNGRLRSDAEAVLPAGDAPPPEVGDVLVGRVEAEAETLHDAARATPQRGRVTVRMPFARGASVVTTTSFVLAVEP